MTVFNFICNFRGNYAWDIAALNENFMTYTGSGEKNDQFAVWDRNVVLPMAGKIVTKVEGEIDNSPDLRAAIDLADHKEGRHVTLTEKPQNIIELKPMKGKESPFLLRMIHLRQNSIPSSIQVVFNTHATNNFFRVNVSKWKSPIEEVSIISDRKGI